MLKLKKHPDYQRALELARTVESSNGPWPLDLLQNAADYGDARAVYALATWYLFGRGVRKNHSTATTLLEKAADQKLPAAEYDLAVCYETGRGLTKDTGAAFRYYLRSAKHGDVNGQA